MHSRRPRGGQPAVGPASVERRFVLLTGLRWLPVGVALPVTVLMLQARGLDLGAVGGLLALYSAVTIVLELPTGGLADVVGRRPVLALASVATALGLVVAGLAPEVWALALAMALLGVGRALGSGPLEAWYVDAVHATDPAAPLGRGLARSQAAEAIGLALGAAVGGSLPMVGSSINPDLPTTGPQPLLSLSIPLLVAAGVMSLHALLVLLLVTDLPTEEAADALPRGLVANVVATVGRGTRVAVREPTLRRVLAASLAVGVVLAGVELLSPGTFADLLGGVESGAAGYGVLVSLGFVVTALGSLASTRAARRWSPSRVATVAFLLAGASTLLIAAGVTGVAVVGYLATYALLGVAGPLVQQLLHEGAKRAERSTIVSVQSLALQAGGAAASLTVGVIAAARGELSGYAVAAVGAVIAAMLLWGVRRS